MRPMILFSLILGLLNLALADADPCKTNYKTAECYSHLRSQIFFSSGQSSFANASRNYVSSFYKKYGFEAFTFKPNERSQPL